MNEKNYTLLGAIVAIGLAVAGGEAQASVHLRGLPPTHVDPANESPPAPVVVTIPSPATEPAVEVPPQGAADPETLGRPAGSGQASWYGPGFHGRRTASGEVFNQNAYTAAHPTLPFGSRVQVINQRTGRFIVVRINDRGPHVRGRIIDLSRASARAIGVTGAAPVRLVTFGY